MREKLIRVRRMPCRSRHARSVAIATLVIGFLGGCGGTGGPKSSGWKWTDDDPIWSPDGRQIAFDSDRAARKSKLRAVYVMKSDGTGVRRLTHGPLDAELPKWSPDGTRLAYVSNLVRVATEYGYTHLVYSNRAPIHVVRADGSGDKKLAVSRETSGVEWSPDGRWIAFDQVSPDRTTRFDRDTRSLEIVRPSGRGLRRLATDVETFAWSPDAKRLVFTRPEFGGRGSVHLIELDSRRTTRLAKGPPHSGEFTDVSWSPDGSQIAFVLGSAEITEQSLVDGHVYVVNVDGRNLHVVSSPHVFAPNNDLTTGAAWLPGAADVLLYNTNNGYYKTSTRKGTSRRLNANEGSPAVPSPDGKKFLFVPHTDSSKNAIYSQTISGSIRQLTQNKRVKPGHQTAKARLMPAVCWALASSSWSQAPAAVRSLRRR